MSRTKIAVRVHNVSLEAVKRVIFKWLEVRGFAILSMDSDGSPILYGYYMARVRLHPVAGRIVCIHYKASGAIAFELTLRPDGEDIVVGCEGYAAGASLLSEKEWDLDPSVKMKGRWPRKKGYRLLKELERDLGSMS